MYNYSPSKPIDGVVLKRNLVRNNYDMVHLGVNLTVNILENTPYFIFGRGWIPFDGS